ncbi:MAG: type II toxin-antitoxin system RelE/ParE family toxin [Candidatus Margulisbacteria bacterium]|jgi:plasmid stabilization system protein ParE|nr:type II toxin-antitoxin system RelE/ParE family toxin [Candidatus Margulisiibacteriota bacterium]
MYIVYITDLAEQELARTLNYIANELKAPVAAAHLAEAVGHRIRLLEEQPYKFSLVQNSALAEKDVRLLPVKRYLLFYTIDEEHKKVSIARFIYSRRDWRKLLK